jgi:hypothetical protein
VAQQTAVEWFFEVLAHNDIIDHKKLCDDENLYNLLYSLKNQAKQIEKEQIVKAHKEGNKYNGWALQHEHEQYYKETYGKDSIGS